jgi:hypothetical protein
MHMALNILLSQAVVEAVMALRAAVVRVAT